MLVIDAFPFNNELDLLEIRLNYLDSIVDKFVITECDTSFSGLSKPLFFAENRQRFSKFESKIVHQVVRNVPEISPFERDWFQRDQAKSIINGIANSDSFLIYGDVDEFPRLEAIDQIINQKIKKSDIYHFAQDLFYYYFNLKEKSGKLLSHAGDYRFQRKKKWLGTIGTTWNYAKKFSMTNLRDPMHKKNGYRIADGGWHFSYVSSVGELSVEDRIAWKIKNNSHQELNLPIFLNSIKNNLELNKDIFGRRGVKFEIEKDLSYLPGFILENLDNYRNQIKI